MKVVLSIKPEFAEMIFNGTKKYEFRKSIFKNRNVKTVIVYASSPVQRVIGEFEIEEIINSDLEDLWNTTQHFSGISRKYFDSYFEKKELGYAIKIKSTKKYRKPKCLKEDYNLVPPQSFVYF